MKQVCVVTNNKNTYFIKRLIECVGISDVSFWNPWSESKVPIVDFYLVRTSGVHDPNDLDLKYLHGIKNAAFVNPLEGLRLCRDKITQEVFFKDQGISTIPWKMVSEFRINDFCSRDVLVKPIRGQGGWGIEVLNQQKFSEWYQRQLLKKDLCYLVQPYLKDLEEYRVFFIQKDFQIVLKRMSSKGVTANFTQEGNAQVSVIPIILKDAVDKIIETSNVLYGAIDFLVGSDQYYMLELNTTPGIEQLEKVSGIDVMKILVAELLT